MRLSLINLDRAVERLTRSPEWVPQVPAGMHGNGSTPC